MFKMNKSSKLICFLFFLMFVVSMTGCRAVWDKKYYEYQPTFLDRASARTLAEGGKQHFNVNGMEVKVENDNIVFVDYDVSIPRNNIHVSDADVLGFSSDIQKALRHRMNKSRRVRLGSATIQVLAASIGATLGFATGDANTAAAFALVSAIIPELQNIFQARGRVEAYTDGLELIKDADALYYKKMTENGSIKDGVSTKELTPTGSELLVQITACIKLVDKALLTQIPTIEDLEKATGRLRDQFKIKAVPRNLSFPVNADRTINIINGSVINASPDNANIVTIVKPPSISEPLNEIKLRGGTISGITKVRLFNIRGVEEVVNVKVGNNQPQAQIVVNESEDKGQTVKAGEPVSLDGSNSKDLDGDSLDYFWTITTLDNTIKNFNDKTATFTAATGETYKIALAVHDGTHSSTDKVTVTVEGDGVVEAEEEKILVLDDEATEEEVTDEKTEEAIER